VFAEITLAVVAGKVVEPAFVVVLAS